LFLTHRLLRFQAGDHVKVTGGESSGETGMVVRVEESVAVVFLDSTKTEIRVFKRDLSESSEIISLDRCALAEGGDVP
jgi:transcription elongation factor